MSNRYFSASFENVSIGTAAQDFFELIPVAGTPMYMVGLTLDNVGGIADAGDAQEELIRVSIVRGYTTTGSGGSTPTAEPINPIDVAVGSVKANNTTVAVTGTAHVLWAFGWNVRIPLREFLPPELAIPVTAAQNRMVIRSGSTLNDAINCSGTVFYYEL